MVSLAAAATKCLTFDKVNFKKQLVKFKFKFIYSHLFNYNTTTLRKTITVISHAFAYSSRWRRKPRQGLFRVKPYKYFMGEEDED